MKVKHLKSLKRKIITKQFIIIILSLFSVGFVQGQDTISGKIDIVYKNDTLVKQGKILSKKIIVYLDGKQLIKGDSFSVLSSCNMSFQFKKCILPFIPSDHLEFSKYLISLHIAQGTVSNSNLGFRSFYNFLYFNIFHSYVVTYIFSLGTTGFVTPLSCP